MNEPMKEQSAPVAVEAPLDAVVAEVAPEPASTEAGTTDACLQDLERRIRELEAAIGDLRTVTAAAGEAATRNVASASGRKTQASYASHLLAKGAEPAAAGGVDAALGSLSVEQRFAVKAGLLRAGLL